tara:strand:- start:1243 stop:1620 length:378 start_codon:yes stop_codon:yes gene_type:complete
MYEYNAKCVRVVDGDTADFLVDLGFDTWKKVRVRFAGINTPETRTRDKEEKERGLKAKARVQSIMDMNENKVRLEVHGMGKYGRALADILVETVGTVADRGLTLTNVNKLLIKEGHGEEYSGGAR